VENISKEKLLKEYRILFYRSREVSKMLTEYNSENSNLASIVDS
jgi:hypothetical protein